MRALGKFIGWTFAVFAMFSALGAVLVLFDTDETGLDAFFGMLLFLGVFGIPGTLILYSIRKSERVERDDQLLLAYMHAHDGFTAGEIAQKICKTPLEAEQLIVTASHRAGMPLLFHRDSGRYLHPNRIRRAHAVVTRCSSCGGHIHDEVVFEGEAKSCQYCGAPIRVDDGMRAPAAAGNAGPGVFVGGQPQVPPPQPHHGQPLHAQPAYAQPQYAPPQYVPPQYGQPQYGQPQYGQPQYGQPQYGQPGGRGPYVPPR